MQLHQVGGFDLVAALQPIDFLIGQSRHQEITRRRKTQNRQAALRRAAAVLRQIGEEIFLAQHTVNGFSHRSALTRPQAKLTKIARQNHVCRVLKFKNLLEK